MPKKFFLVLDSETTQTGKIADLGLVVCDKRGNIEYEAGLMVGDFYCNAEAHPLFYTRDADPVFGRSTLGRRYRAYDAMIADGRRMVASVAAINRLLVKIRLKYNPVLTAYNLAFDADKAANSGIDLSIFDRSFCLWHAAVAKFAQTRAYREFILDEHLFGNRTKFGNMTYSTKADYMAKFVLNNPQLAAEPHTALEDARDYEVPILAALVKNTSPKDYMNPPAYNWKNFQVRDHFRAR